MEVKIHKSLFNNKTLSNLHPTELIKIDGWELAGDMSFDNDDYYYFIFNEIPKYKINYIGPSGERPMDYTKAPPNPPSNYYLTEADKIIKN